MAAAIKNSVYKMKNQLDAYLHNNRVSPLLDLIEKKIHLERSLIVLGMLLPFFFFAYVIVSFV
jgi:hypothetical protein